MARTVVAGRGMPGKETELYTLYDDGSILLREIRGSYVHAAIYQGKADAKTGIRPAPKYGIVALLPKVGGHEKSKRLVEREIQKVLDQSNKGADIKADAKFLRDGDLAGKSEYKGHWTINASERENRPPALRGINGERIDREHMGDKKIEAMFQSGYWYDILISPWWQDNDYGKKVNCNIRAIKLNRKDETFGEGGISDDDIDDAFGVSGDAGGFDDDEPAEKASAEDDL